MCAPGPGAREVARSAGCGVLLVATVGVGVWAAVEVTSALVVAGLTFVTGLTVAAFLVGVGRVLVAHYGPTRRPVGAEPAEHAGPVTGDEVRVTATVEDMADGVVWPSQGPAQVGPAGDLPALPQATTAALEANRVWLREEWSR